MFVDVLFSSGPNYSTNYSYWSPIVLGDDASDVMYEVVFDESFLGGQPLRYCMKTMRTYPDFMGVCLH